MFLKLDKTWLLFFLKKDTETYVSVHNKHDSKLKQLMTKK